MQYILNAPETIDCTIDLPASKSISNRALVINALAGNKEMPENLSICDDTDVMVTALRDMPYEIDIKAAGTAMRFTTALLAVTDGDHVITGTERMKHRPIEVLVNALRHLGADIQYAGEVGFPPLRIRGHQLQGGRLEISGDVSSQYISALLMIGPVMKKGLILHLTGNIISRPYIELTICTMKEFGADVDWMDESTIMVKPQPYSKHSFFVENDWSASSYWYEIAALLGEKNEGHIKLTNLMEGSRQGDSAIKFMFSVLGIKTSFASSERQKPTTVSLNAQRCTLPTFNFDFINQPDLAQTLVVTCAALQQPFYFTGLRSLRIKETDRMAALQCELAKFGIDLGIEGDEALYIKAYTPSALQYNGTPVATYHDHRMAMAFAPLALKCSNNVEIANPEVVSKSYPNYWKDLESLSNKD